MILLWAIPFFLQGTLILWDELRFHRRRGLPVWERIGHPVDSLSLGVALLVPLLAPLTAGWLTLFACLSLVSCLLVTKDEPIHAELCESSEARLHAILFQLHPLVFGVSAALWSAKVNSPLLSALPSSTQASSLLALEALGSLAFMAYQILYWRTQPLSEHEPRINNSFYGSLGHRWYTAKDDPIALLRAESRLRNPWVAREIERRLGPGSKRILDVACGAGFLSNYLASRGHEVAGIDLSRESLEVAQARDGTKSVCYETMDGLNLSFKAESFDVVCSMDFLEHIRDRDRFLAGVTRVLKPGGLFFFHTFNRNPLSWLVVIKGVEWFVRNTPSNMHVYELLCTPEELGDACTRNRLQIETLLGVRPRIFSLAFWKMISTGVVEDDFSFAFTRSRRIAYSGLATKFRVATVSRAEGLRGEAA